MQNLLKNHYINICAVVTLEDLHYTILKLTVKETSHYLIDYFRIIVLTQAS